MRLILPRAVVSTGTGPQQMSGTLVCLDMCRSLMRAAPHASRASSLPCLGLHRRAVQQYHVKSVSTPPTHSWSVPWGCC